jgi:hypothetical protein
LPPRTKSPVLENVLDWGLAQFIIFAALVEIAVRNPRRPQLADQDLGRTRLPLPINHLAS